MLRATLTLTALLATSLAAPARGAADDGWTVSVDLLTMGPGDHLFTRFGHTALLVMRTHKSDRACQSKRDCPGGMYCDEGRCARFTSQVYNYGDADFDAPGFAWRFFRGTVEFYLSKMGTINEVVTRYARDNRTISQQRLALTQDQARELVALLERRARPENRDYRYHHLEAGCASKARDILDEVLDGKLRRALGDRRDPHTARHYARMGYAGIIYAELANDLFMGRLHDRPQTMYYAMYMPHLLSRYLQQVEVPDPAGSGKQVPLAGAPHVLFKRKGPPPTVGEGKTLVYLGYLWVALTLGLGLWALWGAPGRPRRAGLWLALWALPVGVASLMMVFGAVASTVIEGRINELLLVFPPTDIALVGVAWRWLRGRFFAGKLLRGYALLRLGLALLSVVGHATGLLVQQPRVLVALALVAAVLLVLITRRLPRAIERERAYPEAEPA